jgi:diadenosine tetraphosphate (Ap4A) HIT family hydrolase
MASGKLLLSADARFPWFILVPAIWGLRDIHDMERNDQIAVLDDISALSQALTTLYTPDKINVAALGNVVPQLHIHVIARYTHDTAWPAPVWGHGQAHGYEETARHETIARMKLALNI